MLFSFPALVWTSWSWISAAIAEPQGLEIRNGDLLTDGSLADDPSVSLAGSNFAANLMTESESGLFFIDHDDMDSTSSFALASDLDYSATTSDLASSLSKPELDVFADGNVDCEVSTVDNVQLFGKIRRGVVCPDPSAPSVGQADTPGENPPQDPFPVTPWQLFTSDEAVKAGFVENLEICPKEYFRNSNFPVCKNYYGAPASEIFRVPGQAWVHLFNVEPGTFLNY